jgi:hypothetical protein
MIARERVAATSITNAVVRRLLKLIEDQSWAANGSTR